jgi:hypothetical protein
MKPLAGGMLGRIMNRYHQRAQQRIDDAERAALEFIELERRRYEQEEESKVSQNAPWLGPNLGLTSHGPGMQDPMMALFEQLTGGAQEQSSATPDSDLEEKRQDFVRRLKLVIRNKLEGKDIPFGLR